MIEMNYVGATDSWGRNRNINQIPYVDLLARMRATNSDLYRPYLGYSQP
jgi:hypothetical protein